MHVPIALCTCLLLYARAYCLMHVPIAWCFCEFITSLCSRFFGTTRAYCLLHVPITWCTCILLDARAYCLMHVPIAWCTCLLLDASANLSRYRLGVAQSVGRGIALLFHDLGTRRCWTVSRTPRPQFTPGKDPVPIVQEAGWAPGPVWTGAEYLGPTGIRSSDRPAR
jgi:hypothetical protein